AWLRVDPTNNGLQYELDLSRSSLGDGSLWRHFAADPDRLFEISAAYSGLGFFDDAAALLSRPLPHGAEVITEPGMPAADANPLIAYYRGYAKQRSGRNGDANADFEAARRMPTTYIFPNRWETGRVLEAALAQDARDAKAQFLLGSWYLSGGRVQQALQAWNAARAIHARLPGLHRHPRLPVVHALDKPADAVDVLLEGTTVEPQNTGIYVAL